MSPKEKTSVGLPIMRRACASGLRQKRWPTSISYMYCSSFTYIQRFLDVNQVDTLDIHIAIRHHPVIGQNVFGLDVCRITPVTNHTKSGRLENVS